jgi:hypothetical protein
MQGLRVLTLVVLVTAAVVAAPRTDAVAQDKAAVSAETLQAAQELFALISGEALARLTTEMSGAVWPGMVQELRKRRPDISDATLAELRREFERVQRELLAEVVQDAPAIYASRFTADELRQIAAFYRTPAGAKALREMPSVAAESMKLILPRLPEVQSRTAAAFMRVLQERGI